MLLYLTILRMIWPWAATIPSEQPCWHFSKEPKDWTGMETAGSSRSGRRHVSRARWGGKLTELPLLSLFSLASITVNPVHAPSTNIPLQQNERGGKHACFPANVVWNQSFPFVNKLTTSKMEERDGFCVTSNIDHHLTALLSGAEPLQLFLTSVRAGGTQRLPEFSESWGHHSRMRWERIQARQTSASDTPTSSHLEVFLLWVSPIQIQP